MNPNDRSLSMDSSSTNVPILRGHILTLEIETRFFTPATFNKIAWNKTIHKFCLQLKYEREPNVNAISVSKPTIYACNVFEKGPNMLAIIENLF